eukprot:1854918-Alexandrium_andersonii.AAC.1
MPTVKLRNSTAKCTRVGLRGLKRCTSCDSQCAVRADLVRDHPRLCTANPAERALRAELSDLTYPLP